MLLPRRTVLNIGILRLPEASPLPGLVARLLWALGIILVVTVGLWFDRGGLLDNAHPGRPLHFADVLYFTVVSLTTVGYGDIVPVTQQARLINAILLTPIRLCLLVLFLGTTYELIFQRYREKVQMNRLHDRLNHHVIVCGYGVKGRAIVSELLAHDHKPENVLVIEPLEALADMAASQGIVAITGDASQEAILNAAAVEKAACVLAAPSRDDTCVLICLTVRALAPKVRLVAAARDEENVKLLYRAGANLVIAPSVSGGRLMAAAVTQTAVPEFLEDILHFGQGVDAAEHVVTANEASKLAANLPALSGTLILGVKRGTTRCPFHQLGNMPLEVGDVVVYLVGSADCDATPAGV